MRSSVAPAVATWAPSRGLALRVVGSALAALLFVAAVALLAGSQAADGVARSGIERRASLLAVMVSARMREVPRGERAALAAALESRVGARVAILGPSEPPPSWLAGGERLLVPEHARTERRIGAEPHFVATEATTVDGERVVALVAVAMPSDPGRVADLVLAVVVVLAAVGLIGMAVAVVVGRDVTSDVQSLARRALQMASGEVTALEPLPVRADDEVGELVGAFNRLQRKLGERLSSHQEALARLEDAERRKEALIATLRHELRTPLNSVIGFAELLLDGLDGELTEVQRGDVEVVASSGRYLLKLVDDVLDLSALASGRFAIELLPVDLDSTAREVAHEAAAVARQRNLTVEVQSEGPCWVQGDAVSLRRVATNLLQNALEHARGRVVLTVGAGEADGTVALCVKDDGPGIRTQELKRLFKPFERGEGARPTRPGAGLGLAITVALLERHGGTLKAESEIGEGSTFVATLPVQPTALEQAGFA